MRKVIILSGPSGCGKSTWAATNYPDADVCSADHHFIDRETGEYKFDPTKIAEAHAICFNTFIERLRHGKDRDVVVDNTNLEYWERRNYQDVALMLEAARGEAIEVEIHTWVVETVREIAICAKRNRHGVTQAMVAAMALRATQSVGITHKIEVGPNG